MGERQHEELGKSGVNVVENNDGGDKERGEMYRHERQQRT